MRRILAQALQLSLLEALLERVPLREDSVAVFAPFPPESLSLTFRTRSTPTRIYPLLPRTPTIPGQGRQTQSKAGQTGISCMRSCAAQSLSVPPSPVHDPGKQKQPAPVQTAQMRALVQCSENFSPTSSRRDALPIAV